MHYCLLVLMLVEKVLKLYKCGHEGGSRGGGGGVGPPPLAPLSEVAQRLKNVGQCVWRGGGGETPASLCEVRKVKRRSDFLRLGFCSSFTVRQR
jgi:hypothetical protein